MFENMIVSPLDLCLDYKNPRFIIPQNSTQPEADLINYLLEHEDALVLARGLANIKTLLPGERVVICREDGKLIVLEGNRRICICKLFLNRELIPFKYRNVYPEPSDELLRNIQQIQVDIVPSREEAKKYLAARHIQGVKQWSTIAKSRFSYEEYALGRSIQEISESTGLSVSDVKKFIRKYKILMRGKESKYLSSEQRNSISLISIEPDRLLRAFTVRFIKNTLGFTYDNDCNLKSTYLSDEEVDKIIATWTIKAFIEEVMDTRTPPEVVLGFISHITDKYNEKPEDSSHSGGASGNTSAAPTEPSPSDVTASGDGSTSASTTAHAGGDRDTSQTGGGLSLSPGGGPDTPAFFYSLNWSAVPQIAENEGLIQICNEIMSFSKRPLLVRRHPMTAAFQTRALIEHSFKYYARKTNEWQNILIQNNNKDPKLSKLIEYFQKRLHLLINDANIRNLFPMVFGTDNNLTTKLNYVVHQPEQFRLAPDTLLSLPQEGLLTIINYMLT
ncbi:MAG: hypothetical protein ACM3XR_04240 [Bacillota bacterium]